MQTIKTAKGQVHVAGSQSELGKASAEHFAQAVNDAIFRKGRATVGLSGGHTPPLLYAQLTSPAFARAIDWSKVHFFISDERCVPHDDKESNWGMADKLLFSKLKMAPGNLHPTKGQDGDAAKCALSYEQDLRTFFQVGTEEIPTFDVLQLGMGPDGHTASLFPGTKAVNEEKRLVVHNFVEKLASNRITFTFPLINHASHIIYMIEGEEKSHVLSEALTLPIARYPVQHVDPVRGDLSWFVDEAAARDLLAHQPAK